MKLRNKGDKQMLLSKRGELIVVEPNGILEVEVAEFNTICKMYNVEPVEDGDKNGKETTEEGNSLPAVEPGADNKDSKPARAAKAKPAKNKAHKK